MLISGEAAVGKSVLLEEFAEESSEARWLWAGCDGLFTPAALGPLLDIATTPFFVTEVLQAGSDALPVSVRDAVLARTRTLSKPAREELDTAALVGSRMQSELLVSLVDNPLVMDELISHHLWIKDGDDLRFRHEIVRVATEAAVPTYRKAAIHTKILDALLSYGCDDDARLAFHAEGAGNDELVLTYAPRAGGRAAALGARREAAAQYERALRFVPETDIRRRAELLDNLAQQLDFVDQRDNLLETCSAAAALWHELGDSRRECDRCYGFPGICGGCARSRLRAGCQRAVEAGRAARPEPSAGKGIQHPGASPSEQRSLRGRHCAHPAGSRNVGATQSE